MKKTKRPPEEWISVPVPSIISRETWDKANNIMNRKNTNLEEHNALGFYKD